MFATVGPWGGGTLRSRGRSSKDGSRTSGPRPWTSPTGPGPTAATARPGRASGTTYERPRRSSGGSATPYAELHCHSNFSFLDGASHPEELAEEAVRLGLEALAITDHDGFYGVVRFAEAARASGCPPCSAPSCRWADPAAERRARPRGHPPARAGPRPEGYARLAPAISAAQLAGEKGAPRLSLSALAGDAVARRPLAGAHRLPQGHGAPARWSNGTARRPAQRELARAGRRLRAGATWPSSCATTATRSTPPATTPSPSSPSGRGRRRRHQQRPLRHARPPPAGHRAGRGAGPAQPRRARRLAARRGRRPPALGRRAGPPLRPLARRGGPGGRPWAASCAFDLQLVAPEAAAVPVPARPQTRWPTSATSPRRGRASLRLRPRRAGTRRRTSRSTTSWPSSSSSGFPGYFLVVWDIVDFCRELEHLLPGAGVGAPTPRSATRSASPTPTR